MSTNLQHSDKEQEFKQRLAQAKQRREEAKDKIERRLKFARKFLEERS